MALARKTGWPGLGPSKKENGGYCNGEGLVDYGKRKRGWGETSPRRRWPQVTAWSLGRVERLGRGANVQSNSDI
jgi:hypothetical protein